MQLNYHHLYYFYITAREGSIIKAAEWLNLTPQTISGQLSAFERYIGSPLFDRKGKRLVLNERGRMTYSYAEDIFALGQELQRSLQNTGYSQPVVLTVGVTDVIPKVFSFDLLRTSLDWQQQTRLICREGDFESLLSDMAIGRMDLIIADRALTPGSAIKAYSHRLGTTGLTFYTAPDQAADLQGNFPQSLDHQPFLLSGDRSSLKASLMAWFDELHITPRIVAECDDSALLKFFGQHGYGVFCTPSIIEAHVMTQYDVNVIGRTNDIVEQFYGISPERKIQNPDTKRLVDVAKSMFAETAQH